MHKPADTPRPLARDNKSDAPTPMIAQYIEIKAANPDCLLCTAWAIFTNCFSRIPSSRRARSASY
jgi:hypothetical protein